MIDTGASCSIQPLYEYIKTTEEKGGTLITPDNQCIAQGEKLFSSDLDLQQGVFQLIINELIRSINQFKSHCSCVYHQFH